MPDMTEDQRKALEERIKNMSPEELKEFQKKQCIFCRMVAGEIPAKKIYEDDKVFAILDINPASAGHVLLLPKEHYPIMQQMPDDIVGHMGVIARGFSQAFLQSLKVEGSTILAASGASAGQRAQHVMIHLIPRCENDGVGINPPVRPVSQSDLQRICSALKPFADQVMGVPKQDRKEPAGSEKPHAESQMTAFSTKHPAPNGQPAIPDQTTDLPSKIPNSELKTHDRKEAGSSLDDIASFLAGR